MSREKVLEWMSKKSVVSNRPNTSEIDERSDTANTLKVNKKSDKELNFEAWLRKKEQQKIGSYIFFAKVVKCNKIALFKQLLEELERQKLESFYQAQYDHYRKCLSTAFYDKWTHQSREKPRPVPLNKGFASMSPRNTHKNQILNEILHSSFSGLAGSTTNLYVNPQPWNHI